MKMTDEQLVEACLKGDGRAQKELFEKYSGRMMGVCLRYAYSEPEAKDMLQDGFIKIFVKLSTYSGRGSLGGWIQKTIVNTCLDYIRKSVKERDNVDLEFVEGEAYTSVDVYSSLTSEDLINVIQQLPAGYRAVFNLHAIEGYTHREIGEQLGITESTSKSQFRKARISLMEALKEFDKGIYYNE